MTLVHSGASASVPSETVSATRSGPAESLRNDRAQAMFPDEWARMETLTGKRRSRLKASLRNRADYRFAMKALPAEARCGTCLHRGEYPNSNRPTCDLDSDFNGYAMVDLTYCCPRWVKTTTASAVGTQSQSDGVNQ